MCHKQAEPLLFASDERAFAFSGRHLALRRVLSSR